MQHWYALLSCLFVVLFACDASEPELSLADSLGQDEQTTSLPGASGEPSEDPDEGSSPSENSDEDPDDDEGAAEGHGEDPGDAPSDDAPSPSPGDPPGDGEGGDCSFDLVWPTTGTSSEQTLVHDAYGPRLRSSGYDWHRGIDLPGDPDDGGFYSPVHAVADGSIYAIGNRPNPNQGALSNYASTAGNVILLEHEEAALHPGAETLYSVYMHLDTLPLEAFLARLEPDGELVEVDLREYFYLGAPGTNANNRGRRRAHFKTGGEPIEAYPRVAQRDRIATIADTGATFEHLHFELREGSPYSSDVVNPYAYLPHIDTAMHDAALSVLSDRLRARIEVPREPGSLGATTDLSQQLDVDAIALQLRDEDDALVDELRFDFAAVGHLDDADNPTFELEGATVSLEPHDFGSADAVWRLDVDYLGLAEAGFAPGPGEHYVLVVTDVCGNEFLVPPHALED